MSTEARPIASRNSPAEATRIRRGKFFVGMSVVLLIIAFAGFARTFYLRPLFDVPPIGFDVYVHGAILTAWFVWFGVQTVFAAVGRIDLHRQFGMVGALIGGAVIVSTAVVHVGLVPRLAATAESLGLGSAFVASIVWGNFSSLFSFTVLLSSAMLFRRRPEIHKRLMLLASISLIGPALVRISSLPVFGGIPTLAFSIGGLIVFLIALVLYDLAAMKRVHPATVLGGAFRVANAVGSSIVAGSEFGQAVVRGMA